MTFSHKCESKNIPLTLPYQSAINLPCNVYITFHAVQMMQDDKVNIFHYVIRGDFGQKLNSIFGLIRHIRMQRDHSMFIPVPLFSALLSLKNQASFRHFLRQIFLFSIHLALTNFSPKRKRSERERRERNNDRKKWGEQSHPTTEPSPLGKRNNKCWKALKITRLPNTLVRFKGCYTTSKTVHRSQSNAIQISVVA